MDVNKSINENYHENQRNKKVNDGFFSDLKISSLSLKGSSDKKDDLEKMINMQNIEKIQKLNTRDEDYFQNSEALENTSNEQNAYFDFGDRNINIQDIYSNSNNNMNQQNVHNNFVNYNINSNNNDNNLYKGNNSGLGFDDPIYDNRIHNVSKKVDPNIGNNFIWVSLITGILGVVCFFLFFFVGATICGYPIGFLGIISIVTNIIAKSKYHKRSDAQRMALAFGIVSFSAAVIIVILILFLAFTMAGQEILQEISAKNINYIVCV